MTLLTSAAIQLYRKIRKTERTLERMQLRLDKIVARLNTQEIAEYLKQTTEE